MNTSKIIKGVVSNGRYTVTAPIVKEDYGLYLKIEGVELPETYQVDFSNDEHSGSSVTMIGNADGVRIPVQFIKSGKDVFAFLYHVGADFGRTVYKFRIPNKLRPDRTNEQPTPEEQSVIDQVIASLNDAVDRAEDAEQAIEDMSVSAQTLAEGESATVTKTESEGVVHLEFGIPKGATGAQGERGEKGEKGDRGEQGIQGIQGERGLQGAKGDKGDKGDTGATGAKGEQGERGPQGIQGERGPQGPQGDDYVLTEQDKQDIAELVDVPVDDVQIDGQSIVNNGVANIVPASTADIKSGSSVSKFVPTGRQGTSTFYGLAKAAGDTTQSQSSNAVGQYTEEAKIAIQKMLGIYEAPWELIRVDEIENTTESAVDIAVDGNGQTFELTDVIIAVSVTPLADVGASVADFGRIYFKNGTTNVSIAYCLNNNSFTFTAQSICNVKVTQKNNLMETKYTEYSGKNNHAMVRITNTNEGGIAGTPFFVGSLIIDNIKIGAVKGKVNYRILGKRKWQ